MCHILLDLIHNLHGLICTPCLKVIALLLRGIIAAHDHHPEALLQPVALSRKGYALLRTYSTDISIGRIIWCTKERNIYICGH